jgi:hypothetical protein
MSVNSYPRETVEFQGITVTVDGVEVLTGITVCIVAHGARPVSFVTPTTLSGKLGVMLTGLTPGTYDIYAKIVSAPETPVVDCGSVVIT